MTSYLNTIQPAKEIYPIDGSVVGYDFGAPLAQEANSVWATETTTMDFIDSYGNTIVGFPITVGVNPIKAQQIDAVTSGLLFIGV